MEKVTITYDYLETDNPETGGLEIKGRSFFHDYEKREYYLKMIDALIYLVGGVEGDCIGKLEITLTQKEENK